MIWPCFGVTAVVDAAVLKVVVLCPGRYVPPHEEALPSTELASHSLNVKVAILGSLPPPRNWGGPYERVSWGCECPLSLEATGGDALTRHLGRIKHNAWRCRS